MEENVIALMVVMVETISAWITAAGLRRRIRRVLQRDVTELELTSLTTWMKVDEEEEKSRGGKIS